MAAIPEVFVDRYEVGRVLGSGGMAEVFEGRDRLLARRVAIKVLLSHYARDPNFVTRFKREAQSAASLSHPNIVGIYDTGVQDGVNFIVMEYLEGRTLRDVIQTEGPLMPERAAEIAQDVCSALAAAHARGLIHRDIKPANIMLLPDGQVKVMDFGIARAASAESITQTAAVVGTAQYISPEQAQAMPLDSRSDLYSLGCCLYEMLVGQVPFSAPTPVAIAYRQVREDPRPPHELNGDVPAELEAVTLKAMAKNPDNRYQTATEMRADLERARRHQPVEATPLLGFAEPTRAMPRTVVDQYSEPVLGRMAPEVVETAAPAPRSGAGWLIALGVLLLAALVAYFIVRSVQQGPQLAATTTVPTVASTTSSSEPSTSSSTSTSTSTSTTSSTTTTTPTTTTTTLPPTTLPPTTLPPTTLPPTTLPPTTLPATTT